MQKILVAVERVGLQHKCDFYVVIQTIYNMMIYIIVSLFVVILVVFDKY